MMKKPDEFQEKTELTTETKAKITATLERLKEDGIDLYGCDYVDVNDLAYIYHATHYLMRYVEGLQATIAGQEIAQVDFCRQIKQLEAERDAAVETIYEMAKCITEDVCEWCDGVECERLCMMHTIERPGFKWRGVQKEDGR